MLWLLAQQRDIYMTTPSGLPTKALQFWGVATGAVASRATTAEVWGAINDAAAAMGMSSPGLSLRDFNTLRSQAASVRNASERLDSGQFESQITGDMIGTPPWARDLAERNAAPMYQVRFKHDTADSEGFITSDWRTVVFSSGLPPTLAAFHDALDQDAQALADKYNTDHVAVSSVTILAI